MMVVVLVLLVIIVLQEQYISNLLRVQWVHIVQVVCIQYARQELQEKLYTVFLLMIVLLMQQVLLLQVALRFLLLVVWPITVHQVLLIQVYPVLQELGEVTKVERLIQVSVYLVHQVSIAQLEQQIQLRYQSATIILFKELIHLMASKFALLNFIVQVLV
jgi:hypothetical protein